MGTSMKWSALDSRMANSYQSAGEEKKHNRNKTTHEPGLGRVKVAVRSHHGFDTCVGEKAVVMMKNLQCPVRDFGPLEQTWAVKRLLSSAPSIP